MLLSHPAYLARGYSVTTSKTEKLAWRYSSSPFSFFFLPHFPFSFWTRMTSQFFSLWTLSFFSSQRTRIWEHASPCAIWSLTGCAFWNAALKPAPSPSTGSFVKAARLTHFAAPLMRTPISILVFPLGLTNFCICGFSGISTMSPSWKVAPP